MSAAVNQRWRATHFSFCYFPTKAWGAGLGEEGLRWARLSPLGYGRWVRWGQNFRVPDFLGQKPLGLVPLPCCFRGGLRVC